MSSRAFRRLNRDLDVIHISENVEEEEEEAEEEGPGFTSTACKRKGPVANPFSLLDESDELEDDSEDEDTKEETVPSSASKKNKRKKKKKAKPVKEDPSTQPQSDEESGDEIDAAVREVNKLLGGTQEEGGKGSEGGAIGGNETSILNHSLLKVDRRFLNAENEMKRIFGSKVVRGDQVRQRAHRKVHLRPTTLATPKDSWPKIEKLGLTMVLGEVKDWCQHFYFEHSPAYQKIQHRFWLSVESFDPNSIAVILQAHPYHIDSLLQMSEVSKMGEDIQMASELIERALYSFECSFHTLFNYTQANCRLDYTKAENRAFFLCLFRHLSYVERRGCHRTALEFCKLLLGLSPDKDPLCVLLMIDYSAIRSGEYKFIIDLFHAWESHRNLSQLPNFAFSVPLAMFHSGTDQKVGGEEEGEETGERDADQRLQDALLMFPCFLAALLDKCSVTMDPAVMTNALFTQSIDREPEGLKLLIKLYVERSYSLWKEPEVLTWLEANCKAVIVRADENDPIISERKEKASRRYTGVPRNIYRHILISDLDRVVAALPPDMTQTSINMYDPLPPLDSTCGYERPQQERVETAESEDGESPLMLLLRSLLPHYNPMVTIQIPEPRPFARQVFDQVERVRQHYENHYAQYEGVENPPPAPPPPPPPRPPRPRLVAPGGIVGLLMPGIEPDDVRGLMDALGGGVLMRPVITQQQQQQQNDNDNSSADEAN